MDRAWAELPKGSVVLSGTVALVLFETVLRILLRHGEHIPVSGDFGKNRRRSNIGTEGVSFHDTAGRDADARIAVAVNESKIRLRRKLRKGAIHGNEGGVENIERLNLLDGCKGDAIGDRRIDYYVIERIACFRREFFRVVQTGNLQISGQDTGCCTDRTRQRAPAGLVHTGNIGSTGGGVY